jgi:hypothetical protein
VKKLLSFLLLAFLLTACCGNAASTQPTTTIPATAPTDAATHSTSLPTEETIMPATVPTEPIHSALYIPGVDVEDVIVWFNEVCLDAEFVNSGDASVLQKWNVPIRYMIHGDPTEQDRIVLINFVNWLNSVEGFPGMEETQDANLVNLRIYFCGPEEMINHLGDNFVGMDGGVTFWYLEDAIYDGIICYRNDISQEIRNSVILEELYNGLGPVQDTDLRNTSVIYSQFSQPQWLSAEDQVILQLLYHPSMICGMNTAECEAVIRELYR